MKYYGRSEEVLKGLIEQFENGSLPDILPQVFLNVNTGRPIENWSFLNQLTAIARGTRDARTFKQWGSVGRKVKKGSRAFPILAPCLANITEKDKETGEEKKKKILYGFRHINVFRFDDTEVHDEELWAKYSNKEEEDKVIKNLPLREVAEAWGLDVALFNGKGKVALGYYAPGKQIALGVENLSTWCHELIHAADHKNGKLSLFCGQDADNEIVAEIGGVVLLQILGFDKERDLGGAWDYAKKYSQKDESVAIKNITKLVNRICEAVNLVLTTSEEIIAEKEEV